MCMILIECALERITHTRDDNNNNKKIYLTMKWRLKSCETKEAEVKEGPARSLTKLGRQLRNRIKTANDWYYYKFIILNVDPCSTLVILIFTIN